ncbi:MAG: heparan-alpha-glucosaminide N-acetyltransferase [Candidatus Aenigmatarchaeota archaeon]
MKERFWEIDFLRGLAVLLMITYHVVFTLNYFGNYTVDGFRLFGFLAAIMFILLVGISLSLSYSRAHADFSKYLKRGLKIFSYGLVITAVTFIFLKSGFVVFGVLHLIGLSIILSYFFFRRRLNILIGIFLIIIGLYIQNVELDFPYLLWLGFEPRFYTLDYFPLLPWFGLVLIGIFFGDMLYPNHRRRINVPEIKFYPIKLLSLLGRHSLFIYFMHLPIIITLLYVFGFIGFPSVF